MIISHKYRFIFIKTNKTAGTSIEIALSKFCGNHDIITPISPEDEKTRRDLGYRGPQNYLVPIWNLNIRDVGKLLFKKEKRSLKFYNHISATLIRAQISEQVWNSYYKFCFERNPWERAISLYYNRYNKEPRPTISEFINSGGLMILKRRGFDLYTIDGQIAVDKVCLFENISKELEAIRKQLGIPEKLNLPYAKSQYRKDKRSYREILSHNQQEKIAQLFRDEITLFGYES